jgi:hypothetical protein
MEIDCQGSKPFVGAGKWLMVHSGTKGLAVNCSLSEYVRLTLYIAVIADSTQGRLAEGFEDNRGAGG